VGRYFAISVTVIFELDERSIGREYVVAIVSSNGKREDDMKRKQFAAIMMAMIIELNASLSFHSYAEIA
jgi:hypothetical protein